MLGPSLNVIESDAKWSAIKEESKVIYHDWVKHADCRITFMIYPIFL